MPVELDDPVPSLFSLALPFSNHVQWLLRLYTIILSTSHPDLHLILFYFSFLHPSLLSLALPFSNFLQWRLHPVSDHCDFCPPPTPFSSSYRSLIRRDYIYAKLLSTKTSVCPDLVDKPLHSWSSDASMELNHGQRLRARLEQAFWHRWWDGWLVIW